MPITYAPTQEWPPNGVRRANALYAEWDAWYTGDPDTLASYYSRARATPTSHPAQFLGGIVGGLARMWWGRPIPVGQPAAKLHVPLASDLAMFSSDMLFSAPPEVDLGDTASDDLKTTWDRVVEHGSFWPRILEAAEQCAAIGGIYLKACALPSLCDVPFLASVPPEMAVPEWSLGWLSAVTFHRIVASDDKGNVWRHLERYETMNGAGVVYHGVYLGDSDKLGIPLSIEGIRVACPDLAPLFAAGTEVGDGTFVYLTGTTGLAATYVPNVLPNRMIKGSPLGRSDYAGSESFMDALDETWSSWMRDIRLAKARLVVPEHMLRSNGAGKGANFETEQEIFTTINALPDPSASQGAQLTQVQFAIRVTEHEATARALIAQCMRSAGYDVGTIDDTQAGGPKTATQVANEASRTVATRGRKIGYWTPAMRWAVVTLLEMSHAFYGSAAYAGDDPGIEFPDATSTDALKNAQALQALDAAAAVSTETKVRMLHPEWKDPAIEEEVELIKAEHGTAAVAPPDDFGAMPGAPMPMPGQEGYVDPTTAPPGSNVGAS